MSKRLRVEYPLFLSDFNETWIASLYCKNTKYMHYIEHHSYAFQSILDNHQAVSLLCIKSEFSLQIFEKKSNINFLQNPSNGSRVVPYGQTDITKLTVAFRNFAEVP